MVSIRAAHSHYITKLLVSITILTLIHTYAVGSATDALIKLTIEEGLTEKEPTKETMLEELDKKTSECAGGDNSNEQPSLPPLPSTLKRSAACQCIAMFHAIPVPELKTATYEQAIELMNIFIFLYAYAIQLDLTDSEFFVKNPPEILIINNLNTLSGILQCGNIAANTPRFIGMAYEIMQIFNLVGFLPLERDMSTSLPSVMGPALEAAFASGRNNHKHITIAEEWVIKFVDAQYGCHQKDPLASPYLTHQVLEIALNVCQKFLQQLQNVCPYFPPFINDQALFTAYERFRTGPGGKRPVKEIEITGLNNPLEEYHSSRSMKATRKVALMFQIAANKHNYRFLDTAWVHESALMIAKYTGNPAVSHEKLYQVITDRITQKYLRTTLL